MGLDIVNIAKEQEEVTQDQIRSWFGRLNKEKQRKMVIDEGTMELINESINDPAFDGFKFVDTVITYQTALEGTRSSLRNYIEALRFCGFLEANQGNAVDAYIKAFPDKKFVQDRLEYPTTSQEYKDLCSASNRYRKSPIVVNILTQAEVPLYLMFQGYRYKAVARLAHEMENAPLPRDRIASADKLLTHLQPPEGLKIEVDVNNTKADVIDTYEDVMKKMALQKKQLILDGQDIVTITNVSPSLASQETTRLDNPSKEIN